MIKLRRVLIRVDAATNIGTGHVMRCLTLAHALKKKEYRISFICRKHIGHMADYIKSQGFDVYLLPRLIEIKRFNYLTWIGATIENDVYECMKIIQSLKQEIDWMIVDHYGIDEDWELVIKKHVNRILVIDDLANRKHNCDILLDQNFTYNYEKRYNHLVNKDALKLLGPKYTILREEFIQARHSLPHKNGKIERLLVFFGGSDDTNETMKILQSFKLLTLDKIEKIEVDVVVGINNQMKEEIKNICSKFENIHFHFNINYMAELMKRADLAICASGSTTWERYCLGLPGIVIATAENQIPIAESLQIYEIDTYLGMYSDVSQENLIKVFKKMLVNEDEYTFHLKQKKCLELIDGQGINVLVDKLV